jgi:hypothetical protein
LSQDRPKSSSAADGRDPAHYLSILESEFLLVLEFDHFFVNTPQTSLQRALEFLVVPMHDFDEVYP